MRVDYFHTGNASAEIFSLDQVVLEPRTWPGNPDRPIDGTNFGKYRFSVLDKKTGDAIFSRGFCSIFGEWELTEEASRMHRTFSESLRFPCPDTPAEVLLEKRNGNGFTEVWRIAVDPKDIYVQAAAPLTPDQVYVFQNNGDPSHKVDLLILGDGYTAKEKGKFESDAKKMQEALFSQEPFKSHRNDFNVWGICPTARDAGVNRPSTGRHRRSPLGCSYDTFGSERYVLTLDNKAMRDIACFAPYDCVQILINDNTYGGGGIFGLYGTISAGNGFAPYIFVHELGHHFAALADEYYTSDVAYQSSGDRTEPWEPNVTSDPLRPKWRAMLATDVPLPTPWKKAEYEAASAEYQTKRREIREKNLPESEMEALFRKNAQEETRLLGNDKYSGSVGAFEGANYEATGYYRPQTDCIMFSRNPVPFCAACRQAIQNMIDFHTGR
jgi:hypothetical protein